jgi:hypothetical protein
VSLRPAIPSRRTLTLAAVLCAGALLPPIARASFAGPKSLGQLARGAHVILIGRVREVRPTPSFSEVVLAPAALLGCAVFLLRRGRKLWGAATREGLAAFLAVFLAGFALSTRAWYWDYRAIAVIDVDRWIAGSALDRDTVEVGFKPDFPCDMTDFQPGERCLLFLWRNGSGYRTCAWHYGVCKETAQGFRPRNQLAGNWSQDEDELVEEIRRLR